MTTAKSILIGLTLSLSVSVLAGCVIREEGGRGPEFERDRGEYHHEGRGPEHERFDERR